MPVPVPVFTASGTGNFNLKPSKWKLPVLLFKFTPSQAATGDTASEIVFLIQVV